MMPSPIKLLTIPSYQCTTSIICSITKSNNLRTSSGSQSTNNSIDHFISANKTVTCLRSPSSEFFDMRIFSARCLRVVQTGDIGNRCTGDMGNTFSVTKGIVLPEIEKEESLCRGEWLVSCLCAKNLCDCRRKKR